MSGTQLAANAVMAANIGAGAVGSIQLAGGAVGTTQLAANAVTAAKIGAGEVGTAQLALGAVTADRISTTVGFVLTNDLPGSAGALVGRKQSISATLAPGATVTQILNPAPAQLFVSAWACFDSGTTYRSVPMLAPAAGTYGHGNGQHGAFSTAGTWTQPRAALSATAAAGSTTVQLASAAAINAGELVLLLQARGGNAGQWSIHRVVARSSNVLTLDYPTPSTFDTTGPAVAFAQKVHEYTTFTLSSGTIDAPAWDGGSGGVIAFYASGAVTLNGSLHANGRGWRGGTNAVSGSDYVFNAPGEAQLGTGSVRTTSSGLASGAGGGAGCGQTAGGGGSGAGAGADGTAAGCYASGMCLGQVLGAKGSSLGAATGALLFGGGGGASGSHSGGGRDGAAGGAGGGVVFINAASVTVQASGILEAKGANGVNGYYATGAAQPIGGGGGGAGGSIRVEADNVSFGSARVSAAGGTGGISNNSGSCNPSGIGGDGGTGRIVTAGGSSPAPPRPRRSRWLRPRSPG